MPSYYGLQTIQVNYNSVMSQSKPMPGQIIPESSWAWKQIVDIKKSL